MKAAANYLFVTFLVIGLGLSLRTFTSQARADGSKPLKKFMAGENAEFQLVLGKSEVETIVDGYSVSRVAIFPVSGELNLKLFDIRNQSHDVSIKPKRWMIVSAHKIELHGGDKSNEIRVVSLN
ncbi:MAG: hypothetical protein P1V97_00340 [Planctomycetota bacterium]|nr:hypothetical protein [Planctomycetota bacterium]